MMTAEAFEALNELLEQEKIEIEDETEPQIVLEQARAELADEEARLTKEDEKC